MRNLILLFLFIKLTNPCTGQLPVSVDSLYTFIKYNSVHRKMVNWNSIDTAFWNRMHTARSLQDTLNGFVFVLESLKDVHSQILFNNQSYGCYPSFNDTTLTWLTPLVEKSNLVTNNIVTKYLSDDVAYISIPGIQVYGKAQINAIAEAIYDSTYSLSLKNPKGIIIDLRLNGGGNIYPMLSGLSSFLGENIVGYETDLNDSIVRAWEIKNSNFIIGGYKSTELTKPVLASLNSIPVVVLIGPVTRSAGSMTAIAFKQRNNTILIGEPTADGYTTSNGYFQFAPNLILNFATHFVADRKKNIYKFSVEPDIMVYHGDNFENLSEDANIKDALIWLSNNSN
ncbi:MAG TPA: S41 family peptidase [Saprospiraceae bacterium]|nr:S41 family peptidase [Saprospiraceae bacterium]